MILGVVGSHASGKDTVAEYLAKKGWNHYSLSDEIRLELDARGLEKDRDSHRIVANDMRATIGHDVFAQKVIARMEGVEGNSTIVSIRNVDEAKTLQELDDFYLIAVDAPIEIRYARTQERMGERDHVSFEEFKKQEQLEMTTDPNGMHLHTLLKMAEYTIDNGGTEDEFYTQIDILVDKFRS